MSFLSTLGKIFHVVQVVSGPTGAALQLAGQLTGDDKVKSIATGVMVADQLLGAGNGAQKKQVAMAIVNSVHPGLDQAVLGGEIDTFVGLFNQLSAAIAAATPATESASKPPA